MTSSKGPEISLELLMDDIKKRKENTLKKAKKLIKL